MQGILWHPRCCLLQDGSTGYPIRSAAFGNVICKRRAQVSGPILRKLLQLCTVTLVVNSWLHHRGTLTVVLPALNQA